MEPVRQASRQAERGTQQGDGAAARARGQRDSLGPEGLYSADVAAQESVSASILRFPERRSRSLAFAPFVAQQIAQQDEPATSADARVSARAAHAYRVAAGQEDRIIGPVRPRQLAV